MDHAEMLAIIERTEAAINESVCQLRRVDITEWGRLLADLQRVIAAMKSPPTPESGGR